GTASGDAAQVAVGGTVVVGPCVLDGDARLDPLGREVGAHRAGAGGGAEAAEVEVADPAVAPDLLLRAGRRGLGERGRGGGPTISEPLRSGQRRGRIDGESAQGIGPLLEGRWVRWVSSDR